MPSEHPFDITTIKEQKPQQTLCLLKCFLTFFWYASYLKYWLLKKIKTFLNQWFKNVELNLHASIMSLYFSSNDREQNTTKGRAA